MLNPFIKVEYKDTEDGHFYGVDGENTYFPGATTILKVLGKQALVPWAAKKTAEAYTDMILKAKGEPNLEKIEKEAQKAPFKERDKAGDHGTNVHNLIDEFLKNGVMPKEKDSSFEEFLKWYRSTDMRFLLGDTPVISVNYGFGGKLDALFVDKKDRIVLVDFKTSKGIYDSHFIQLGAYATALEETYGLHAHQIGILHIRPNFCKWYETTERLIFKQTFLDVLSVYKKMNEIQKIMEGIKNGLG